MDLHRCECSGTRLLSPCFAQQHETRTQAFALNLAAGYLCSVKTQLYEQWIFIGVNAVGQGSCHLVLHSSTKQEPKHFALNPAAGYLCSVKTQLYEQWIFIGVNAVGQGCCHLVLHSSTKQDPKRFALNPAAGYLCSVKTQLYEQ